jgi:hypothetical protein
MGFSREEIVVTCRLRHFPYRGEGSRPPRSYFCCPYRQPRVDPLYWDIGRGIVEKQKVAGWGDAVVEQLAADLRAEFPDMRGFSARSIWEMKRLYLACSESNLQQAAANSAESSAPGFCQPVARLRQWLSETACSKLSQAVKELVRMSGAITG